MDAVNQICNYMFYQILSQQKLDSRLLEASKAGNLKEVSALLQHGAHVYATDSNNRTPLMWACINGHTYIADFLLQNGADINATDNNGENALMFACEEGHTATAAFLLEKGADINATNNFGSTSLMYACINGHTGTAAFLLQNGVDINARNNNGDNAMRFAERDGDTDTTYLLLSWMTQKEQDAFANQPYTHEIVQNFKTALKNNALTVYDKIRFECWKIEPESIFQLLPPELLAYIRGFEAQLEFKEKFKDSCYRFRAFTDMNLVTQCCAPYHVDKPIFPVLFLSNKRKAQSEPEKNNRPTKKICASEKMENDESAEPTIFSKNK